MINIKIFEKTKKIKTFEINVKIELVKEHVIKKKIIDIIKSAFFKTVIEMQKQDTKEVKTLRKIFPDYFESLCIAVGQNDIRSERIMSDHVPKFDQLFILSTTDNSSIEEASSVGDLFK